MTTTRPVPRSTRMFAGVRSRWTTPRAWACASAAATGAQYLRASSQSSVRPRDHRVEGFALHELHDEHRLAVVLQHVVEADDVRVLEPGEGRSLALESLPQLGIVRDPRMEHLECDVAAEPLVSGAPDHAHAAAPELLAEAIPICDCVVDVLHERHLHGRTPGGLEPTPAWFGDR